MTPSRITQWLDHRTGGLSGVKAFLRDPIPKSVGWRNTLGSAAGALLFIQILTGILLALYYVPHPEAAYESVQYIDDGLIAGGFVRALHYWGASFVIVVLFLHMARTFFSGAYKAPREANWVIGVVLFVLVTLLAFTGQLLLWNQMGYWAANVGIEIAASAPGLGGYVEQLLVGGDSLGALTLTRFYALHAIVLPLVLGLLIVFHLVLLRRHGPTRPARDTSDKTVPFSPLQLFRDTVVFSLALGGLIFVALIYGGPDSAPADPTDTSYIPHPEWYFLSHYQVLRYTPGSLKVLTTFVLPNLVLVLLLVLPWLDRAKTNALGERKMIVGAGAAGFASVVILTVIGIATLPENESAAAPDPDTYDIVAAGQEVYVREDCATCHRIQGEGQQVGPDLSGVGNRLKEDYMRDWLQNPQAFIPNTQMPPAKISRQELTELVAYLQSLRESPQI